MKHKSGLHKKVSSIFDGAVLPGELTGKAPFGGNDPGQVIKDLPKSGLAASDLNSYTNKSQRQNFAPVGQSANKSFDVQAPITEDQQFAASQRKKLFAVLGLFVVLVLVLFFQFYKPAKKTAAVQDKTLASAMPAKVSQINWPRPEVWSADIRDPMVFNSYAKKSSLGDEAFVIKGIVRPPDGRASVLIGTEILYEGDQIQSWTVKQILQDVVLLEKSDGQKKELKWD